MNELQLLWEIRNRMDPDELVDVLGLTTTDLVAILYEHILERRERFEEFLDYDCDEV